MTVCPICLKVCHTFRITNDRRVGAQVGALDGVRTWQETDAIYKAKREFLCEWHPEVVNCPTCGRKKTTCDEAKKKRQDKIDQVQRENARNKPTIKGARKLTKAQKVVACKPHEHELPVWWLK